MLNYIRENWEKYTPIFYWDLLWLPNILRTDGGVAHLIVFDRQGVNYVNYLSRNNYIREKLLKHTFYRS